MDIDEQNNEVENLGINTDTLMKAKQVMPENDDNVLFQPAQSEFIQNFEAEQKMESENQSLSTNVNDQHIIHDRDVDPSCLQALTIRCCLCGVPMTAASGSTTCVNCLKSKVDITEGINRSVQLQHCRECNRYQRPPWTHLEAESPQLLSHCLKQVKGLKRVKLIDAAFIWTEPHSKRLKVKITIQKEVLTGTNLQQTFIVDYIISNLQCDDCKKTYTPHLWQAQVQVRQRVEHKRTFLFLEQMILKHNAQEKCIKIESESGGHGLNFQFKHRSHAQRLVDFINDHVLGRHQYAKQLISHEEQNSSYHYKYTFNVELAPICRDDLVILPKPLSALLGGIGPMVLVYKISKFVHIVDIKTMQTFEIDGGKYHKHMFKATLGRERMSEFVIINIENVDNDFNNSRAAMRQKFRQVQVEIMRSEDFGVNDRTFIVNTHLGNILNFNDTVLAYDLSQNNISDIDTFAEYDGQLPDVVIVKKTYPKFRKRQKNRIWKLKHFDQTVVEKEEDNEMVAQPEDEEEYARLAQKTKDKNKHVKKATKSQQKKLDRNDVQKGQDYELFLQDIEDDPELRQNVNLYKDDDIIAQLEAQISGLTLDDKSKLDKDLELGKTKLASGEERDIKKANRKTDQGKSMLKAAEEERIKNDQILKANQKKKGDDDSDWESVEEDAPVIQLTDLLGNMKIGDDDEEEKS